MIRDPAIQEFGPPPVDANGAGPLECELAAPPDAEHHAEEGVGAPAAAPTLADRLAAIVTAATEDVGAPFEPAALAIQAEARGTDQALWARHRAALKAANRTVSLNDLLSCVATISSPPKVRAERVKLSDRDRARDGDCDQQGEGKPDVEDMARAAGRRYRNSLAWDPAHGVWRRYCGTHWERLITREETDALFVPVIKQAGRSVRGSLIDDLERAARRYLGRDFVPDTNLLSFVNGTLDVNAEELRQHRPDDNLTFVLPYPYEPGPTPYIDALLASLTGQDAAIERNTIKGQIGLALRRDTTIHKALAIIGPPGAGKTTLQRLINSTLGQEPDCTVPGEIFSRDREASLLRDQYRDLRICSVDEFPSDILERSEEPFKKMVAHGGIDSRGHYKAPVASQWVSKFIITANNVPSFSDDTGAMKRRLECIRVAGSVPEDKRDPDYFSKIQAELSGFVAQCLEEAGAILASGRFPQSPEMAEFYQEVSAEGDPLKAFVAEHLVLHAAGENTRLASIYECYKIWCGESGHKQLSKRSLSNRLRSYAPWEIGKREMSYGVDLSNIRLRTDADRQAEAALPCACCGHTNWHTSCRDESYIFCGACGAKKPGAQGTPVDPEPATGPTSHQDGSGDLFDAGPEPIKDALQVCSLCGSSADTHEVGGQVFCMSAGDCSERQMGRRAPEGSPATGAASNGNGKHGSDWAAASPEELIAECRRLGAQIGRKDGRWKIANAGVLPGPLRAEIRGRWSEIEGFLDRVDGQGGLSELCAEASR